MQVLDNNDCPCLCVFHLSFVSSLIYQCCLDLEHSAVTVLVCNIRGGHGLMASMVVWAYNEGPGHGDRGQNPPEAEALLVFWTFNRSCKFAYFSKILKQRNQVSWVATKLGGGAGAKLGPPSPGLKPPLTIRIIVFKVGHSVIHVKKWTRIYAMFVSCNEICFEWEFE